MSNPTKKTNAPGPDWASVELRKAAVEYAIQKCGEYARRRHEAYLVKLEGLAGALGVPSAKVLLGWITDKNLGPEWRDRPGLETRHRTDREGVSAVSHVDVQTMDDTVSELAGEVLHIPGGALPDAMADPLAMLVAREDCVLSEEEREEMAAALEKGVELSRAERLALAVLLRGSDLAGRREVVRAVLDWISPPDDQITDIWEWRQTDLTVPAGSAWRLEPVRHALLGRGAAGKSRLVVESAAGEVLAVRLFCVVKTEVRTGRGAVLKLRYLAPVKRFAKDHVLYQFALLASLVREDPRDGKEWGRLFGVKSGKAIVSYHKKQLVEKLQTDTGSKVGMGRNLRHKADPRKGRVLGKRGGNDSGEGAA